MERHIGFEALHNFRDLGGYSAAGGARVRWGVLFRGDSLGKLRGADWERFLRLGVRTVIDLRYPWEVAAAGRVPEAAGLRYVNLSIEHRPYDQTAIGNDVDPWRFLADRYAEVAADGGVELRRAVEVIAGASGPVAFHCASGKDRTGVLAAVVLSLLGVSEEDIVADFSLTERATARLVGDWRAAHEGREPGWRGYGRAPADVMRLFLADMAEAYGSVCGYAATRLGVDDAMVAGLRAKFLESAPGGAGTGD